MIRRILGWCDARGHPREQALSVPHRELAREANISRRALPAAIAEAVERRYIRCLRPGEAKAKGRPGQSGVYELRWDGDRPYTRDRGDVPRLLRRRRQPHLRPQRLLRRHDPLREPGAREDGGGHRPAHHRLPERVRLPPPGGAALLPRTPAPDRPQHASPECRSRGGDRQAAHRPARSRGVRPRRREAEPGHALRTEVGGRGRRVPHRGKKERRGARARSAADGAKRRAGQKRTGQKGQPPIGAGRGARTAQKGARRKGARRRAA